MSKTDNSTLGRAGIILIAVLALACSTPHALAQAETWAAKAPMPTARDALVVGVIDGMLYAVGGEIPSSGPNVALGSVEAYDPRSNSWTSKSVMPTPRYGAGGGRWWAGSCTSLEVSTPPIFLRMRSSLTTRSLAHGLAKLRCPLLAPG